MSSIDNEQTARQNVMLHTPNHPERGWNQKNSERRFKT